MVLSPKRIRRQGFDSASSHLNHLLKLHALCASQSAHIALYGQNDPVLKFAVVAAADPVIGIWDLLILVAHSHTVEGTDVALGDAVVVLAKYILGLLPERGANM